MSLVLGKEAPDLLSSQKSAPATCARFRDSSAVHCLTPCLVSCSVFVFLSSLLVYTCFISFIHHRSYIDALPCTCAVILSYAFMCPSQQVARFFFTFPKLDIPAFHFSAVTPLLGLAFTCARGSCRSTEGLKVFPCAVSGASRSFFPLAYHTVLGVF